MWRSNVVFFCALQGLSSALAILHDFHASDFNLQHIGCHHDLKPANVLVKNGSFLLADFGLSRLKTHEEDSKTTFRGMNFHNAPECLDFDAGYTSSAVGRKSDIWALGTIVLDVVIYLLRGPEGLSAFEKSRKHKIGVVTFYCFHHGGQDHPLVHSCIEELEAEAPPSWRPSFSLIKSSLSIDPSHRPTASSLLALLNFAALKVQGLYVAYRLETFASTAHSYDATVESKTLRIWASILGLSGNEGDWSTVLNASGHEVNFNRLSQCLSEIDMTLCGLENMDMPPTVMAIRQLSRRVDLLVAEISISLRSKLNNQLELELLHDVDEKTWLELRYKSDLSANTSNLIMLAIAKIVAEHQKPSAMALQVPRVFQSDELGLQQAFGSQSMLAILNQDPSTSFLVEWIPYDRKWRGDVGTELFDRVRALASILHAHPKPKGFSNLHCLGFYHATERLAFGLVFQLPQHATALKTLKQLFTEVPAQAVTLRPPLGNVFILAHSLANSVLQFHKANWLHKNISALNICFGRPANSAATADITQHYLIGFNHSRPDSPDAFTHGPNQDPEQKDYSHPEYLRNEVRFRYIFDYYSLGLVLLELGLWRPLKSLASTMKNEEDQSPEALRSFLLKRYVPRLSVAMGSIYQGVVTRCLTSQFGEADGGKEEPDNFSILASFNDHVVTPLNTCRA
jgi:serine/threonine protein kinase